LIFDKVTDKNMLAPFYGPWCISFTLRVGYIYYDGLEICR